MSPSTSSIPITNLTPTQIHAYLGAYPSAIAAKSSLASLASKAKESLVELDEWYQSLPLLSSSSDGGLKTKQDLVRLMHWKLAREKHRPTLLSLISSNAAAVCSDVLARASTHLLTLLPTLSLRNSMAEELMGAVTGTMKILCELRGVGPATSSAIVASWVEWGIFQSDELVQALRGRGCKVVYGEGFYKKFYAEAIEVLKALEGKKEGKGVQSGRVLERLAWGMFYAPDAAKIEETQSAKDEAVELQAEKAAKEGKLENKAPQNKAKRKSVDVKPESEPSEELPDTGRRTSKRVRTKVSSS